MIQSDSEDEQPKEISSKELKPSKKRRVSTTHKFKIVFDQINAIKQLLEIVGSILGRVCFRLVQEAPDSVFITIDTIDPCHVCIVQAKMACKGNSDKDVSFCVDTKTINTCLKNVSSHCALEITGSYTSSKVELRAKDMISETDAMQFCLDTFDQDIEELPLDKIVFDFSTFIDIPELRRTIKLGNELSVENIEFHVSKQGRECCMRICGQGDASFVRELQTELCDEDDVNVKEALEYASSFKLSYISKFIKNMDHQQLTMKLGKGQPMLIHYPLGLPESFVRFVLAPKVDNDEQE